MEITAFGITIEDVSEIRSDVATIYTNVFPNISTDASTPQGNIIDGLTNAIYNLRLEYAALYGAINIDTAIGIALDGLLEPLFNMPRIQAQAALVTCQVTGIAGTTIPAGSQVQDSSQRFYKSQADIIIGIDGTGEGTFESEATGDITVPANTVTRIVQNISGWDTVNNAEAGTSGIATEPDDEYRARHSVQNANMRFTQAQGTTEAVLSGLRMLDGVVATYIVIPPETGPAVVVGSVTINVGQFAIVIYGGSNSDIAESLNWSLGGISNINLVGDTPIVYTSPYLGAPDITYHIIRPIEVPIYIGFELLLSLNETIPDDTEEALKEYITNAYNNLTNLDTFPKISPDGNPLIMRIDDFARFITEYGIRANITTAGINRDTDPSAITDNREITLANNEAAILTSDRVRITINLQSL